MAYEWQGKVMEGAQGDIGATGDKGEPGSMGSATKQPALHIGSVPIKTGTIYFYRNMFSTDIVSTGTISVISNEGLVTSAPLSKMALLSVSLPACDAPTEENRGEGTFFYGYVDQNIDLSSVGNMDYHALYRISDDGNGTCRFSIDHQYEKPGYGGYKLIALKLNQNTSHFSTFLC